MSAGPSEISRMAVSTDLVASRDRVAYWADVVCRQLIRAEVCSVDSDAQGFQGILERTRMGGMDVCRIRASGQRVVRTPAQAKGGDEPVCVIALQVEGSGCVSQNGRLAVLKPGDVTLFSNSRPYELRFDGAFEQRVFILPQSVVVGSIGDMDTAVALGLGGMHPGSRLLRAFGDALADASGLPEGQAVQLRAGMLETLSAVVASAVGQSPKRIPALKRYHLARIHAFIRDNLADPDLDVERIAAAMKMAPQHVHRLFEDEARTVSATIWHLRLTACCRDLALPALGHLGVADIACRWGFSDPAHFSRRFRQAFGASPRDWRMAALAAVEVVQPLSRKGRRSDNLSR